MGEARAGARHARAGSDHRAARAATVDPLRQRSRTDRQSLPGLVPGEEDRTGAHPARQAESPVRVVFAGELV